MFIFLWVCTILVLVFIGCLIFVLIFNLLLLVIILVFVWLKYCYCDDYQHLHSQNISSDGFRCLWAREYRFPRTFPNQTSIPASARMKPRLSFVGFSKKLLALANNPCCNNTTGWLTEMQYDDISLSNPSLHLNKKKKKNFCINI